MPEKQVDPSCTIRFPIAAAGDRQRVGSTHWRSVDEPESPGGHWAPGAEMVGVKRICTPNSLALNCSSAFQVVHEKSKPQTTQISVTSRRARWLRGLRKTISFDLM